MRYSLHNSRDSWYKWHKLMYVVDKYLTLYFMLYWHLSGFALAVHSLGQ